MATATVGRNDFSFRFLGLGLGEPCGKVEGLEGQLVDLEALLPVLGSRALVVGWEAFENPIIYLAYRYSCWLMVAAGKQAGDPGKLRFRVQGRRTCFVLLKVLRNLHQLQLAETAAEDPV